MHAMKPSAASGRVNQAHAARFVMISFIFISVQIAAVALGWAALKMVNATRAYATGEFFYSKAANAAVLNLYRYADTGREAYWNAFRSSLDVTFGDREARKELEQFNPDLEVAAAGLLRGLTNVDDIPDVIRVFRLFQTNTLTTRATSSTPEACCWR